MTPTPIIGDREADRATAEKRSCGSNCRQALGRSFEPCLPDNFRVGSSHSEAQHRLRLIAETPEAYRTNSRLKPSAPFEVRFDQCLISSDSVWQCRPCADLYAKAATLRRRMAAIRKVRMRARYSRAPSLAERCWRGWGSSLASRMKRAPNRQEAEPGNDRLRHLPGFSLDYVSWEIAALRRRIE